MADFDLAQALASVLQPTPAQSPMGPAPFGPAPALVAQSAPGVHTIDDGPEFEKWDEALIKHGAIRMPKHLNEPQQWLSQDHFKKLLDSNGILREDRPDGSVILYRRNPTS